MKKSNILKAAAAYVFLLIILVFTIFPLFYTIAASFKSNSEILAYPASVWPREFTLENYKTAWNSDVLNIRTMFWNSTYYTLVNVFAILLTSSMAGYVFARSKIKTKKFILALFSATMFLQLGSITVYPLLDILNAIGLNKSLWGLILIKCFSVSIVNILLVRSYITSLPKELDEAATLDGCGFAGIFFRIIMPLLKPIMATIALLIFQSSWNEYLMPTIFTIGNPDQQTLIVGIVALKNSGGAAASSWNLMLAGSTIALIPVLIAYAIGNKFIIAGLTSGAVKG